MTRPDPVFTTHPSFERLPHRESVAHVSEDPQDDDAGLEICDSGLGSGGGQTDRERDRQTELTDSTRDILKKKFC